MRETKIIQVYPSDYEIENAIKIWQSFGWEMTDNQKFSDKENLWYPGGTTVRTTTYNKLTFSREKNSVWYGEIKALEEEYESITAQRSSILRNKPQKKALGSCLDFVMVFMPIPPFTFFIYLIIKKVKFKKAKAKFESEWTDKLNELASKAESVRKAAQKVIDEA